MNKFAKAVKNLFLISKVIDEKAKEYGLQFNFGEGNILYVSKEIGDFLTEIDFDECNFFTRTGNASEHSNEIGVFNGTVVVIVNSKLAFNECIITAADHDLSAKLGGILAAHSEYIQFKIENLELEKITTATKIIHIVKKIFKAIQQLFAKS